MVIPFPAGSAADIIARAMEPAMRERLGQPLVIDNRGGAGGNIAAELTAKSPPDGYTLMMATIGTHAINISLYSKVNHHPQKDFTPITLVGDSPNAMVVHPSVPVKTVKEFITLAKSRPGVFNCGHTGAGTTVHLSAELFGVMAGVKMLQVPYKGASEALTALLSGETDLQHLHSCHRGSRAARLRGRGVVRRGRAGEPACQPGGHPAQDCGFHTRTSGREKAAVQFRGRSAPPRPGRIRALYRQRNAALGQGGKGFRRAGGLKANIKTVSPRNTQNTRKCLGEFSVCSVCSAVILGFAIADGPRATAA
jgi:hypothetical protein